MHLKYQRTLLIICTTTGYSKSLLWNRKQYSLWLVPGRTEDYWTQKCMNYRTVIGLRHTHTLAPQNTSPHALQNMSFEFFFLILVSGTTYSRSRIPTENLVWGRLVCVRCYRMRVWGSFCAKLWEKSVDKANSET